MKPECGNVDNLVDILSTPVNGAEIRVLKIQRGKKHVKAAGCPQFIHKMWINILKSTFCGWIVHTKCWRKKFIFSISGGDPKCPESLEISRFPVLTVHSFLPYNMRAVRKTILLSVSVYGIVSRRWRSYDRIWSYTKCGEFLLYYMWNENRLRFVATR